MLSILYLQLSPAEELCFIVEHRRAFDARGKNILRELAQITPDGKITTRPRLLGPVVQVGPRMSMVSPWSSSAVEILAGCRVEAERFEVLRRYAIPKGVNRKAFAASLFDRMTEQVYDKSFSTFERPVEIPKVEIVPVLEGGREALRAISKRDGLGFDNQDVEIYHNLFANVLKRNPTNAEMFLLGQVNSNHCRHLDWNAEWTIDGVVQKETLFQLIKKPYTANPGNALIAFHDNSSVIAGFPVKMAVPKCPWTSSAYIIVTVHADGTLTQETHNHPTGVAPHPGAGSGTGGRMRDGGAVGIGGRLGAALAGFLTANLNLSGYHLPWERPGQKYPFNLTAAAEIIRLASDGACDYNNPVGEPVILGCSRAVEMRMPDGTRRAWFKPIMASGGIGIVRREHIHKKKLKKGMYIVQIGGPTRDVGYGGGSASSQTSGDNKAGLDWKSVQRAEPEMAIRDHRVVRACTAMGRKNPICLLHDQGAGGVINVLIELSDPLGALIHAGKIRLGDKYMAFVIRIGAESQERYGIAIKTEGLRVLKEICEREGCPLEILGRVTGDGRFVVRNDIKGDCKKPIDLKLENVLAGMPQKKFSDKHVHYDFQPLVLPRSASIGSALNRVLRNLAVASKEHYTHKGDRSVGGLVVQQQHCGPVSLPVADCGVIALSHFSRPGQVFSLGEQPLKLMIDPKAGARMAGAEAVLNMAPALITSIEDMKSSVNWMWAMKYLGEGAAMFDACKTLSKFFMDFGMPVRGKDSSSMLVKFDGETVPCPRQVMITMQAMMPDVRRLVTPDIKRPGSSELWLMDLGLGKNRMGGSILGQCYNQWGNDCPDIGAGLLRRAFNAIQELIRSDLILSYHDRSDGGLIVTLLEMAFSGNCGFDVSQQFHDPFKALFSEEAGAVLEVAPEKYWTIDQVFKSYRVPVKPIGRTSSEKTVRVWGHGKLVLSESMVDLRQVWRETSYQIRRRQITAGCALAEKRNTRDRTGISYVMPQGWDGKAKFKLVSRSHQPLVAILRERGTNSDDEMVASFKLAGFNPVDVAMKDLESGAVRNLNKFSVLAACGGFADGDVLGSARGWAAKILHNEKLFRTFWEFIKRNDTLSYWVCNGAQFAEQLGWFPYLPEDGRPVKGHPIFTYNISRKFEARWSMVEVGESPAVMMRGLQGTRLGVHVAHGEGCAYSSNPTILAKAVQDGLVPLRFVDDCGQVTEKYPFNPNGSPLGITSFCTPDGRHFVSMPHLERSVQMRQWQYVPEGLKRLENSPWLRAFENMRTWLR